MAVSVYLLFSVPCRASTRLFVCLIVFIVTKCFIYDICDTTVSQVTTWCGTPPQRFEFFSSSPDMFKTHEQTYSGG